MISDALATLEAFAANTASEAGFYPVQVTVAPPNTIPVGTVGMQFKRPNSRFPNDQGENESAFATREGVFPPNTVLREGDIVTLATGQDMAGDSYIVVPPIMPDIKLGYRVGLLRLDDFALYTLTFSLPNGTFTTDPNTGNQYPTTATTTLQARLTQSRDKRLIEYVGADVEQTVFVGHWGVLGSATARPLQIISGMTSPLEINGIMGTLTVHPNLPEPLASKRKIFGEAFAAVWEVSR